MYLAALAGLTLLLAAGAGPARAAAPMTLTVHITAQGETGDVCQYYVQFDASIVNSTGVPVVVQSVDYGAYNNGNARDGGLHSGTVLQPGTNDFPNIFELGGLDQQPCNQHPPPPLVLTVGTDHGTLVWDQSAQPLPSSGATGALGLALLTGIAFVASQRRTRRRLDDARSI
jgi:hypothetical protein